MPFSVTLYRDDVLADHDPIVEEDVVALEQLDGDIAGEGRGVQLEYTDGSTEFFEAYTIISEVRDT